MKRILLTGATGFAGRELARQALASGIEVIAPVRPGPRAEGLAAALPQVHLVPIQPGLGMVRAAVERRTPDAAIHLAASYLPDTAPHAAQTMIEANISFGTAMLELLRPSACRVFVAAGSQWQHATGQAQYSPNCLYAATKQAFGDILDHFAARCGFRTTVLKVADSYGPGDRRGRLIGRLAESFQAGRGMDLSPGEQELDLIHVRDVAAGFLAAAQGLWDGSLQPSQSWALRGGHPRPLREVVALMERIAGGPVGARLGALDYPAGTVMTLWRQPLLPGWKPAIPLEDGLRDLLLAPAEAS
ncbi:NAD-dependent epimerase/dehydratase family protein [Paracoccus sp. (in: a-proteobacteria)]|uniref:NAD-dependent epimerase/dehydratase family protein n=1 Tax=Paracoccus sp. TaxID=267 RepID=UPI0035B30F81